MTESKDRPSDKLTTRLEMMAWGAAVVMVSLLVVGAGIMIANGHSPSSRSIGLHLITMGAVMIIAVGAAANHRAIIERQNRHQEQVDEIQEQADRIEKKITDLEKKVSDLADALERIAGAVVRDDIANHRRDRMHN
jgi:uncharacterized protein YlxW (UPF0749 family)